MDPTLPHGREGIGISQPQGGLDFPLVLPSDDVAHLFADFSLTYDDPSDYDPEASAWVLPFRIKWLAGFGTDPAIGVSPITPIHSHDLLIVDANDAVVFDSTTQAAFSARDWGTRLKVLQWGDDESPLCFAVIHTAWSPDSSPVPREYSSAFEPAAATLDSRTIRRLPKRVKSITAILDRMQGSLELVTGFNTQITTERVLGNRNVTRLILNATPGSGIGVFPGCEEVPLLVRTINGVRPRETGEFYFAASDCYFIRPPTRVLNESPRVTVPEITLAPGNAYSLELPADNAGKTKAAAGWPLNDSPQYAHLQFGNDCQPCCDCEDYIDAAKYMDQISQDYRQIGLDTETVKKIFVENRNRFKGAVDKAQANPLHLAVFPQGCPMVDIMLQINNATQECMTNVEIAFQVLADGDHAQHLTSSVMPLYSMLIKGTKCTNLTGNRVDRYTIGGTHPNYTAFVDSIDPGRAAKIFFRVNFEECGQIDGYPITVRVHALMFAAPDNFSSGLVYATLNCPGDGTLADTANCRG